MSPSLPGWLLQSGLPAVSSKRVTEQRPWVQRVTAHGGLHKMHVSSGAVMGVRPQEAPKWVVPSSEEVASCQAGSDWHILESQCQVLPALFTSMSTQAQDCRVGYWEANLPVSLYKFQRMQLSGGHWALQ